jgi:hypothetical protein
MATVGGETVTLLNGTLPILAQALDRWTRPGIDGYGSRTLGTRAQPQFLELTHWTTNPDAFMASIKALEGTLIDITTSRGESGTSLDILTSFKPPQQVKKQGAQTYMVVGIIEVNKPE